MHHSLTMTTTNETKTLTEGTAGTLRAKAFNISAASTEHGNRIAMAIDERPACLNPAESGATVLGESIVGTGSVRLFYSRETWQDWQEAQDAVEAVKGIKNGKHDPEFPEDAFAVGLEMVEVSNEWYEAAENYRKKATIVTYIGTGGRTLTHGQKSARANKKITDACANAQANFFNSLYKK